MIRLGDFKITDEQRQIVSDILDSTRITENKYVKLFEEETSKFLNVSNVIAVSNGTVALQLVAQYLKFYNNCNTVCIPATTFPATLNAFYVLGYNVILCDIDPETLCIDIDTLSEQDKERIDVIVPVSLLGYTPDMNKIKDSAMKYGWIVVEDFAESFGSIYDGKKLGSIGDFGCSSFYVSHVLQGGELGIVTTNNKPVAKILRSMKNHGRVGKSLEFNHAYIGSNFKTTEFTAGLCYSQMKNADTHIKKRQSNAEYLFENINKSQLIPFPTSKNYSHLGYPIRAKHPIMKKAVCDYLELNGVETRGMFPCLARQQAYFGMFDYNKYPNSVMIEDTCFYIPVHQYLSNENLTHIVRVINEAQK